MDLPRRLAAEFLGTAFLLATVIGSGIMADRLSGGNVALALLGNTIPTGAILVVLITMFGPVSGAHFNPAVTAVAVARRELALSAGIAYVLVQILGAFAGTWSAHLMFAEPVFQASHKIRTGSAQWLAEGVATFGLLLTILVTVRVRESMIAAAVGLYITAAYWFTASTSFANPAVTIARSFSDTFAGIRPSDAPEFILAQFAGGFAAMGVATWLFWPSGATENKSPRAASHQNRYGATPDTPHEAS
jgi:glycerol uptake facilitator-like aquaporin